MNEEKRTGSNESVLYQPIRFELKPLKITNSDKADNKAKLNVSQLM